MLRDDGLPHGDKPALYSLGEAIGEATRLTKSEKLLTS